MLRRLCRPQFDRGRTLIDVFERSRWLSSDRGRATDIFQSDPLRNPYTIHSLRGLTQIVEIYSGFAAIDAHYTVSKKRLCLFVVDGRRAS
jgi:hypothetical protein